MVKRRLDRKVSRKISKSDELDRRRTLARSMLPWRQKCNPESLVFGNIIMVYGTQRALVVAGLLVFDL